MTTNGATELEVVVDHNMAAPPTSSTTTTTSATNDHHHEGEAEEALELRWSDITIKHGKKKLLYGVSGKVKGRFLAIMGSSGSGKV
jgi:hypothetical protein